MNNSNAIEAKVHELEAQYRRDREAARRQASLANERLLLAQQEYQAALQTASEYQSKLERLRVDPAVLEGLQAQVDDWKQKVSSSLLSLFLPSACM